MRRRKWILTAPAMLLMFLTAALAGETPQGKGLTDANKERTLIDDMADISGWYNGSPVETTLSRSDKHAPGGKFSLKFANVVDHTRGEKNYPIGWPRTGKDLARARLVDWSGYDFFECWIFTETSRPALPATPLSVGFYHAGGPRSSSFPLKQVKKDAWVKIIIPVAELAAPRDVQRIQFNISEADYKHGDRVDFYIADVVLTRFIEPAAAELRLQRRLLYSTDTAVTTSFKLVGHQERLKETAACFEIGQDAQPRAQKSQAAARSGEITLDPGPAMPPGLYWARLSLLDRQGKLLDRKQVEFRVIPGPF